MDGFVSAGIAGILFAEDFGEPPVPEPIVPAVPEPPPLTAADLRAAAVVAVQDAQLAWAESAEERRTMALELIADGFAQLRQEAAERAEAAAEAVARAVMGAVAAVLPALSRRHGDGEVRALLREVLPVLGAGCGAVVRAHPGVLALIADDLAARDEDLAAAVTLRPANLPPGDLRLSWEGGSILRDAAATAAAVTDCLSSFGLLPAAAAADPALLEQNPRSLAHVG